jgi:diguanylate cyclase (GGDEF)-like protein/PAS domain S-box-containing protein
MHPYVVRHMRRHFGSDEPPEILLRVLKSVSSLLEDVDRERELDGVAMNELSRELQLRYESTRLSERRYRLLFDESPMAMFAVARAEHRVLAWNRAAERLLGHDMLKVVNHPLDALDLGGGEPCALNSMLDRTDDGPLPTGDIETAMYTSNGVRLDVQLQLQAREIDDQPAVLIHVRDVTAQRESERAQRDSESRFRAFFDYAGIAIHVLTFEGQILEANPASQDLLGYDALEIVGRTATSLSPDEDVQETLDIARELRNGVRDTATVERRFFHKDGHLVWGQLTVSVMTAGNERRMIGMIQDISERKRMEAELVKQAFHDELTGLANRVLFRDRLHHALLRRSRSDHGVAVILLDLDGFKRVNDSLGHAVGDELLQAVGRRIAATVRAGETVARLGGDEFAIVIESYGHEDQPEVLAERVLNVLRQPIDIAGREVVVGVSIGIASATADDDAESVLRNADTAMYAAKAHGKACYRVFDPAMHHDAMEWLELEGDLRLALEREEFFLEFHPLIHLKSGGVKGFEALIRWTHPTRGVVPPGGFVSIAEETGLIVPIGRWVLLDACRRAAQWQVMGGPPPTVSVNLAAKQLAEDGLLDDVRWALESSGLDPRRLVLEITESDVMRDPEVARIKLESLKQLGIRLAIDDFGTGYSSLSYLQYFPVDELKIDRSFVKRIETGDRDAALVRTIVSLARSLNVEVVAEGVEEIAQERYLRDIDCDIGQGYLYSRPLPAANVPAFLAKRRSAPMDDITALP